MNKIKKIIGLFLAFVLILSMVMPMNVEAASKVKINKTKTTMYIGSSETLKISGTSKKVIWTSSNKKVATVNSKGKVTPKKQGTATITAKVSGKKYTCKVTVKKPYINTTKKTVYIGSTFTLKLTGTSIKSVKTSNSKVATVTKKGKVTAKKAGTATITLKGKDGKKYTCKVTVNKTHEHSYTSKVTKEATCAAKGVRTYTCSCGDSYTEDIPKTSSHTWDDGKVTTKATCTKEGVKTYTCKVCDKTQTEKVAKANHTYEDTVTSPTCTEQGYTTHTCSECGDSYVDTYTSTIEHTESEWITDKQATCKENGSKHKECIVCHTTLKTEIITDGHSYDDGVETTKPSCSAEGEKTYTCSKCGATKTETLDKLSHTESEWITDKQATCTETGSKHKECTVCHTTTVTETLNASGHSYVDTVVAPTCTEKGYTEHTCSICKDSYKDTYQSATGHTYGEFIETLAPADFETFGTANMVCPTCNETLFSDLTAVKVDLGNGNSETMYGYYDYDEAKECFDLTYNYLANHENSTIVGWVEKYGFVWNEDKYNYACIRTAEMAYQFETLGEAFHSRPNGNSLGCAENLLYVAIQFIGVHTSPIDMTADEAFQKWLSSEGHKDNIESGFEKMAVAQFKVWIPSKESWTVFWVQDFY